MSTILNNKKLLTIFITFLILLPVSLYAFRFLMPQPINITKPEITPLPTKTQTLPANDPQRERLEYVQTKKPLSVEDEAIKFEILSSIGESQSPVLYQSSTVTIDYVRSADVFQSEILTADIESAKNETMTWFKNKGLSDEGICNLPLSFYLNYDIKSELGDAAAVFDPKPLSCQ